MTKQAKIIIFSISYLIGILASFSIPFFSISLVALILFSIFCIQKKKTSQLYIVTIILVFFIGLINTNLNVKEYDDLSSYTNNKVTLDAKVLSIPSNNIENRTKFFAEVKSVALEDKIPQTISAKTMITINDNQENIRMIKIGDSLKITGQLKPPIHATNPSQFDYAKYLKFKKTFSLLYAENEWEVTSHAQDLKGKLLRKLNDTRNRILLIHKENIKSPMIEILGGIIFGDDAVNPDEETKKDFIDSGIFHILAASGMNVTLIFGIWFFFAKSLKLNYRFSIITGILLILVYTCMTGFGPPIIRAFLMLTLILIGKLIDKETSTLSLLFLVGFLMLLYNPLMIFDIGFQLSFIVTFALILTAPLLVFNFKFKPINYILGACIIPIIAQLYAAPLQMFYFNTFAVYSVFANISIVPVLSIVSFIGFISSILALIPFAAQKVCLIADTILNPFLIYIIKVANFFANLPHAIIETNKPELIQVILYFAIIITMTVFLLSKKNFKQVKYILILLLSSFIITFVPKINNNPEILFFSVGNADAILIKSPKNKYYLIDSGKLPYGTSISQANYIIINYLKDNNVKELEGFILSHFDSDHAGGTIDILENLNVKEVYISNTYENTILSNSIIKHLKDNKIKTTIVDTEEININNENDFSLKITKPQGKNIISENQKSLIVLLETNNKKALFMGDGDTKSYNILEEKYTNNINIMKSGHHGAYDTINNEMIKNTDIFVISTGANVYNHPHPQTIEQLENSNKKYYRTDDYNAIKTVLKKNTIDIYAYSPDKKKFIKQ